MELGIWRPGVGPDTRFGSVKPCTYCSVGIEKSVRTVVPALRMCHGMRIFHLCGTEWAKLHSSWVNPWNTRPVKFSTFLPAWSHLPPCQKKKKQSYTRSNKFGTCCILYLLLRSFSVHCSIWKILRRSRVEKHCLNTSFFFPKKKQLYLFFGCALQHMGS